MKRTFRSEQVSIIIPTCAAKGGFIQRCLETLRAHTSYDRYEIVCVENIPRERQKWRRWLTKHADRVVRAPDTFNWSHFNNIAAAQAAGHYLLFLNDDVEIIEPDWLNALLEQGARPEVGAAQSVVFAV